MKAPLHLREYNRAREYYNPLRGLDIPRAVRLIEEAERGRYCDLQKLNRTMEKRHPTLRALKARRLAAIKKLDWSIKIRSELPPGITEAQAERQRVSLRAHYEPIGNLPQAFEFLAIGSFRGFSHLEPHYLDHDASAPIVALNPVPQYHWLRDQETFAWRYDAAANGTESGSVLIEPTDFIIREVEDPLYEIALLCGIRRAFGKKNWMAFMEDYAIPSIFAMLSDTTPADKVKEWLELIKQVTSNSRGALPPGSKVETLEAGGLDGIQFKNFISAEDEDLVLAGTGGLLSMLTADTGLGGDGQSSNHDKAFDAIALAEAREISSLFQTQFDARFLAREFPNQPPVAYFELAAEDQEDLTALADRVVKFHGAGLESDAEEISERVNMKLTRRAPAVAPQAAGQPPGTGQEPAVPGEPETPLANRAAGAAAVAAGNEARLLANAGQELSAGDQQALAPVIERVMALAAIEDEAAFAEAYTQFMADLPDLEKQCLTDDATDALQTAFSGVIGVAVASGIEEASEVRNGKAAQTPNKALLKADPKTGPLLRPASPSAP